jgi:TonB family protein
MGYQALLFCPDEKTARTVTQVLNELDFTVIPCTEPFAAVKKLMGEHFDAVVVDCDNEQNATLLFKSARNTINNQSALAVAVVEGQAGVAKAFRIGANLVLTKPINVEQAKGTVRVARGLLRKNEGAKPATAAASTGARPAAAAPQAAIPNAGTASWAAPTAPLVMAPAATTPTQEPAPWPNAAAAVSAEMTEAGTEPSIAESDARAAKVEITSGQPESLAPIRSEGLSPASSARFGTGAASAPAPAREPKASVSTKDKASKVLLDPESDGKVAHLSENTSSIDATSAPSLTFGGTVGSGAESAGGGKKVLLAMAAVVLIAAGGYGAWTQWGRSNETANVPARVAAQPETTPAAVPQGAPRSAPVATSSAQASTPDSASALQPTGTAKTSSDRQTSASAGNANQSKVIAGKDSSKPSPSTVVADKVQASKEAAQPIVIKNGLSKPAGTSVAIADAPSVSMPGIASAGNGGGLPNLLDSQSKAPTPVLQTLSVSQGVSQGLLLKKVQPTYPANALRLRTEGSVQLLATISKSGDISAVKILSGDSQLAHAAADAVKQWKYKPYLLNGSPVEIQTQVTVNFKLPN